MTGIFWKVTLHYENKRPNALGIFTLLVSTSTPLKAVKKTLRYFQRHPSSTNHGKITEISARRVAASLTI